MRRFPPFLLAGLLLFLILGGALLSLSLGTADIPFGEVYSILAKKLFAGDSMLSPLDRIVLNLRIPRVLLALLVGGALAAAGSVLQGIFRNPMAEPYVLGISSGAAFGVTIFLVLGITSAAAVQGGAFLGAMGAAVVVLLISHGLKGGSSLTLLLTGITISFFLAASISFLMFLNRDLVESIIFWTFGSFSAATWGKLKIVCLPIGLSLGGLIYLSEEINLLSQGEDVAFSLGVNLKKVRILSVLLTSLLTATAVSVSGIIGFIGLIIPHVVRALCGPDYRHLIILSALLGAFFTMVADGIARSILSPAELPVGILTALLGAPYFLLILAFGKKERFA